jgi:hypothetical protein
MKIILLCVFFILCSCSQLNPLPRCSKDLDIGKRSAVERSALADAKRRFGAKCNNTDAPCRIKLFRNKEAEIVVLISFLSPDRASGKCLQGFGMERMAVYGPTGEFRGRPLML